MSARARFSPVRVIEAKRDGAELSAGDISAFVRGIVSGDVHDAQASAFAMAVFFRGMTAAETAALTRAMLESGERFEFPDSTPPRVDKHSTGGIGDKVSLVLAPLLACDGLWVPMISGRGLGITGGTLDKLESIPGFRVGLSIDEAVAQIERIGVCMAGQTESLCPADRKLYALRDVTGTVPSRPLIVASIMSKKLAEDLSRLVLDVKFGSGAFMKTRSDAEQLAADMQAVANDVGLDFRFRLTPMDEPLGRSVGNALEVREAVDTLRGGGPPDLRELVLDLAADVSVADREMLARRLDDGTAFAKFEQLAAAQGADPSQLLHIGRSIGCAACRVDLRADRSGVIRRVDAGEIGRAALALGAGRTKTSDSIDPSVGFSEICKRGDSVDAGDLLLVVHAADRESAASCERQLSKAILIE